MFLHLEEEASATSVATTTAATAAGTGFQKTTAGHLKHLKHDSFYSTLRNDDESEAKIFLGLGGRGDALNLGSTKAATSAQASEGCAPCAWRGTQVTAGAST